MSEGLEPLHTRTLRQRIGGRWALSARAYIITSSLGVLSVVAGDGFKSASIGGVVGKIALGISACLVCGVFYFFIDFTFFRNRRQRPLPVWAVALFNGISGLIFSVTVAVFASGFGIPMSNTIFPVYVATTVMCAVWWGPTLSYFLDYREEVEQERAIQINHAIYLRRSELQRSQIVDILSREIADEVATELEPLRRHIVDYLATNQNSGQVTQESPALQNKEWLVLAELLTRTAKNSVRPLSIRLSKETASRYPPTAWGSLVTNIVKNQPFRPLATVIIDILFVLFGYIYVFGVEHGILIVLVGTLITFFTTLVANSLMRRYPQRHMTIFLFTIVLLQFTVVLRSTLRELWIPGSAPLIWQVIQVIAGILIIFVISGFGAWQTINRTMAANFADNIRNDLIEDVARSQQVMALAVESSQVLHGAVQTRLVSCSMMIAEASRKNEPELLNKALTEALEVLHAPFPSNALASCLTDEITRKVALWNGLCTCDIHIGPDSNTKSQSISTIVGRVVEEGLANAVRHGKASHVTVNVSKNSEGNYLVYVNDNGSGPKKSIPGMGSAYLAQVSGGEWSLSTTAQGAELRVLVLA